MSNEVEVLDTGFHIVGLRMYPFRCYWAFGSGVFHRGTPPRMPSSSGWDTEGFNKLIEESRET